MTRKLRLLISLLLIYLLAVMPVTASAAPTATPTPTLPPFDETVPEYSEEHPENLTPDQLYAQSAILINQDTGEVLMEKNADARMNPASTTKIMTLLLALEYGDVNKIVTIPPEAAEIPADSSVVPVKVGKETRFLDLLYGLMLKSGNDAANAVAVEIAGSVEAFVNMMNDRAAELGCVNTHFVNPHGYTAEGHYTTARDMALITQAGMQIPIFRKIVSTGEYTMYKDDQFDEALIQNSNLMVVWGGTYHYLNATGVKTGTTSAAGQCLVGSATDNGINLISVVLKSTVSFPHAKWQDTRRMMEYGFAQYVTYDFDDLYSRMNIVLPISGAAADDPSGGMIGLNAVMNRTGKFERTIRSIYLDELMDEFRSHVQIQYTRDLVAPIEVGTIIGNLTFTPEEGDVITAVLVADRSVAAAPAVRGSWSPVKWLMESAPDWLLIVLFFFVLFLAILIVGRIVIAIRRQVRRNRRRKARLARQAQARKRPPQRPASGAR